MAKPPRDLSDDELVQHLQEDLEEVKPAKVLEEHAPVDMDRAPAEGHTQEPL